MTNDEAQTHARLLTRRGNGLEIRTSVNVEVENAIGRSQELWCPVDFLLLELPNAVISVHMILGNGSSHPPDECLCKAATKHEVWGSCWIHSKAELRVREASTAVVHVVAMGISVAGSWGPVWNGEVLNMPRMPRPLRLMSRSTLDAFSVHLDQKLELGRKDCERWSVRVADENAYRRLAGEPQVVLADNSPTVWRRMTAPRMRAEALM
jgi:hypothetical protein